MKRFSKRFLSLFITAVVMFGMLGVIPASAAATYTVTIKGDEKYSMAFDALSILNKERTKNGAAALNMNKDLMEYAMLRADELAILWDHNRPDGSRGLDFANVYGENIAYGYGSAKDVCNGWLNSSGHRGNILNSSFKSTGLGCTYVNGTYYWVQVFAKSKLSTVSKPADKTVTRTSKISTQFKSKYIPSATPKITSTYSGSTAKKIRWGSVSGANGYRIYRYDTAAKKYVKLATVNSSTLTYTDKTVVKGKTYKYKVRAYKKVGAVTGWTAYSEYKTV